MREGKRRADGEGKRRADGEVKREAEAEDETTPVPGEGDVTLARMSTSLSPSATSPRAKPRPFPSASEIPSETERTGKRVKVRRRYSDSKTRRAFSGHAGKCICCKQTKFEKDGSRATPEVKTSTIIRAEEVQSNLEPAFPSFIKSLVRSHVAGCFWMGLPGPFCRAHLPREDTTATLVDEYEKGFRMKYIAHRTGLSSGWRQFSVAHQLLEGDVLVFQLIGVCKFKVYVIRANDLNEVDGALGLLNLDAPQNQIDAEYGKTEEAGFTTTACKNKKRKRTKSLPLAVVENGNKKSRHPHLLVALTGQPAEQSENDSEEVGSEVLGGFKLSLPSVQFEDMRDFEHFHILVDGVIIDTELPEEDRNKYYKLCCSQSTFLHGNLIKGLNVHLVAGIISETVKIADNMKVCSLATSCEEFATWDKSLQASEMFGMNVGFLRDRLDRLVSLGFDSEGAQKARRYIEAKTERDQMEEEIRNVEAKLEELKAAHEKCAAEVENLKSKAESYEQKFQTEVIAPCRVTDDEILSATLKGALGSLKLWNLRAGIVRSDAQYVGLKEAKIRCRLVDSKAAGFGRVDSGEPDLSTGLKMLPK